MEIAGRNSAHSAAECHAARRPLDDPTPDNRGVRARRWLDVEANLHYNPLQSEDHQLGSRAPQGKHEPVAAALADCPPARQDLHEPRPVNLGEASEAAAKVDAALPVERWSLRQQRDHVLRGDRIEEVGIVLCWRDDCSWPCEQGGVRGAEDRNPFRQPQQEELPGRQAPEPPK